jgi:quercetin dioxygenase-like cupin family protein
MNRIFLLSLALATGLWSCADKKETPAASSSKVSRTVLLKNDLTGVAAKKGQLILVEVPPGEATGKHTHPVDEFVYILEGAGNLERAAAPSATLKTGESMYLASGDVHEMKNASTETPLKFLQFSVTEEGQPLAVPAH